MRQLSIILINFKCIFSSLYYVYRFVRLCIGANLIFAIDDRNYSPLWPKLLGYVYHLKSLVFAVSSMLQKNHLSTFLELNSQYP